MCLISGGGGVIKGGKGRGCARLPWEKGRAEKAVVGRSRGSGSGKAAAVAAFVFVGLVVITLLLLRNKALSYLEAGRGGPDDHEGHQAQIRLHDERVGVGVGVDGGGDNGVDNTDSLIDREP